MITKTWNTSCQRRTSTVTKPVGLCTSPGSTLTCTTTQDAKWGSPTHCHAERTMVRGGETMTTSPFSVRNSLQLMQYVLSPDYHLKERNGTSLGTSGMQTVQASRRMLSHGLQETSGNPKGSLSELQNGQNVMDYCASGTASMFQMIRSYVVTLLHNTMTARLQATQDAGKPWSL